MKDELYVLQGMSEVAYRRSQHSLWKQTGWSLVKFVRNFHASFLAEKSLLECIVSKRRVIIQGVVFLQGKDDIHLLWLLL